MLKQKQTFAGQRYLDVTCQYLL